ncbi:hypothetical protein FA95DRAFT_1579337 [Auriscalpium vulgare]|uniref:Uncharacterized protein n=1 Tax=Auriscalpium vulgare TaxID=40419 RepID=A0ACB8SBT2_9AGAM|nr:hypothetical protein FA95DRAFT_1579337 [Auriscalpium vulgare]
MSPGLLRAREPYRVKNAITGLIIFGFAVGTWAYSLRAVKQDTFDDVDEEARALVGSGAKSLEDEARELEAARKAAAFESAPPARPAGTTPAQGSTEGQRGLLVPLEGTLPRLLDPRGKTLHPGTTEPLYQVKLLSALRSGDPAVIHPFLAEIGKERRRSQDSNTDVGAAALHLAIRCASTDTVLLLLDHRSISPNAVHPTDSGTTALHLAASLGRADVVNLLLEQDGIDDTLKDRDGNTCKEVARGKGVLRVINDSRAFLNANYRSLLRTYVHSPHSLPPPAQLIALLSSPRVRLIDLCYLDDASGSTLLHEAAKRKDLRLVELAVRGGADVFVRDRRGRPVQDVVGKDDKMRVFLRQFKNHDTTLIDDAPVTEPPSMKGYLNKYTNVARGYSPRWFVLHNGVLSYYRHQEDEHVASRGSIAMKTAVLRVAAHSEKLRFEVHSTPSRGHSNVQKWFMKANHHVEAARWAQAIGKAIDFAKAEGGEVLHRTRSTHGSISSTLSVPHSSKKDRSDTESVTSSNVPTDDEGPFGAGSSRVHLHHHHQHGDYSAGENDREASAETSSGNDSTERVNEGRVPPHEHSFELHGNSAAAQLELTTQLLANLLSPSNPPMRTAELTRALKDSLATAHSTFNEYSLMVKERDDWWRARLAREQKRQTVWEESLASVVKEGEALEQELRTRSRRRSRAPSEFGVLPDALGTVKGRPSILALSPPPIEEGERTPLETTQATATTTDISTSVPVVTPSRRPPSLGRAASSSRTLSITPAAVRRAPSSAALSPGFVASAGLSDEEDGPDTDDEDEFFDAIESNALPNLVINDALEGHTEKVLSKDIDTAQYEGYTKLRQRLPIENDNRPPTSLWSVLKHSIGKDLTKISFPVFFNEPTSMLQRMAEDMEFTECLDCAAGESDPLRRIAFVAAFAMSNYSSTIGRIAKPFNPMLSETFEYVRLDKEFRYVSEQVSHHPPISACWAEGPRWRYYGEVDAQNKFTGKSFEIRPTGVAHADLFLPPEQGPGYPVYQGKHINGVRAVEHYSWKKVTTNVSGFILGSPTIDHYGDMVITNHRTQDQCVLTFKPRGWRGKDAFEISGYVADKKGNVAYEIAGRWNSQLIMRPVNNTAGPLNPDAVMRGPGSPHPTPEYILLWRNSEKPTMPFNLTPFAVTLNDAPSDLRRYIAPTDCRLRPDQRAFELGRYERANELKQLQEEHQRATRKARDEGRAPPHRPRWFSAETEGDTGERVWTPVREGTELAYWVHREKVFKGEKNAWKSDHIFIEDEP